MDSIEDILNQFASDGYDDSLANFDFIKNAVASDAYDVYSDIGIDPSSIEYELPSTTNQQIEDLIRGGTGTSGGINSALNSAGGLLKSGSELINKNKTAAEIIAGALGNAYKAKQDREKTAEQQRLADEKRKRVEQSILGMNSPSNAAGMLSSLTRTDGSRVFQNGRIA